MMNLGSFTIVAAIYDQGYQGPQSSFNSLSDICSMARISGFTLTNLADAGKVAAREIPKPGFRIIGLSQRCAGDEIYEPERFDHSEDLTSFQYSTGKDLTIICANFTLAHGLRIQKQLKEKGIASSLFTVNPTYASDWSQLLKDAKATGRVLILDDAKGLNTLGCRVAQVIANDDAAIKVRLVSRNSEIEFGIASEEFKVPQSDIDLILK